MRSWKIGFVSICLVSLTACSSGYQTVTVAKSYLGKNPTNQNSLWCQDFVNHIEVKMNRPGTNSRAARSSLSYGTKITRHQVQPGDLVVLKRGQNGGHSGYFVRWDGEHPVIVSGNVGDAVAVRTFHKDLVLGYRRPPASNSSVNLNGAFRWLPRSFLN